MEDDLVIVTNLFVPSNDKPFLNVQTELEGLAKQLNEAQAE